jgi:hypothetical protein
LNLAQVRIVKRITLSTVYLNKPLHHIVFILSISLRSIARRLRQLAVSRFLQYCCAIRLLCVISSIVLPDNTYQRYPRCSTLYIIVFIRNGFYRVKNLLRSFLYRSTYAFEVVFYTPH